MERYIIKNGKKLRCGLTTGTCAAAAAAAAARDLCTGQSIGEISVNLPDGQTVILPVRKVQCASGREYAVIKDGGDDPDVTSGTEIRARVEICAEPPSASFQSEDYPGIALTGGDGIGIVTKKGLEQDLGMPAINPVPRKMILAAVCEERDGTDSSEPLCVTISAPEGEKLARKTFNPVLGVAGGISILGTSGRVEPMSERAIVDTIELQIRQKAAEGHRALVLVPGNYGKRYAVEDLGLPEAAVIQCSNYVGETLERCLLNDIRDILLVGNLGKLVKLAAGIMNTHSRWSDARWEVLAAHAGIHGATAEQMKTLKGSATTEAMLDEMEQWGIRNEVMADVSGEIERHVMRRCGEDMYFGAVIFSEKYRELARTENADILIRRICGENR